MSRYCYNSSYGISYARQGYIYFCCRCYDLLPEAQRERIDALIAEVGAGGYERALRRMLCTGAGLTRIGLEEGVSTRTLYRLRQKFYNAWVKKESSY